MLVIADFSLRQKMLIIKFKKIKPEAILPVYAHETDAGFDLNSCEDYVLKPSEKHIFTTGLTSEIPDGYFVVIKPRSGLAVKAGIDVLAGIIDSGYRGEWGVVLINLGAGAYEFKKGDKIAQGILLEYEKALLEEVKEISDSEREAKGFGSTGR